MKKTLYTYTFLFYSLVTIVFLTIYISVMGSDTLISFIKNDFFSIPSLFVFIIGIAIHEVIHYVSFRLAKVSKNNLKIGFSFRSFMPYVHCKETVSRKAYVLSAISPFVFLAIIPLFLSILFASVETFVFSLFMAKGAAGDLASILLILTKSNKQSKIMDSKAFGFEVRG